MRSSEHGGLGLEAVEFAIGDPPQDMLGAIAADAEIGTGRLISTNDFSQISFRLFQPAVIESPAGTPGSLCRPGDLDERFMGLDEVGLGLAVRAELRGPPRPGVGRLTTGRAGLGATARGRGVGVRSAASDGSRPPGLIERQNRFPSQTLAGRPAKSKIGKISRLASVNSW